MLSDQQLEIISEALIPLFQYLEKEVLADLASRIKDTMSYSRTAELQALAMRELGYSPVRIRKEVMKILRADLEYQKQVARNTLEYKRKVKSLLEEIQDPVRETVGEITAAAGDMAWKSDLAIWRDAGKKLTDRSYLPKLVEAFAMQTAGELKNMTGTTGFKMMSGYESIEQAYRKELDKALIKICSGTFSKEAVIESTVHNLAQSGLRSIDFASGYSMQLDTAVRLAVRTGCHQLAGKITDKNIEQTGENLIYVSKHWGARNTGTGHANHEKWQGQVYYIKSGKDYTEEAQRIGQEYIMDLWYATGYSVDGIHKNDPLGLDGYNCRHKRYPWFEGISNLPPEDEQPKPVTINGKTYDYYAISQKMRAKERAIRALKREKEALKALGMDIKEMQAKISRKTAEYKEFCKVCNVQEETSRLRYECGTSDLKKTKAWGGFEVSVNKTVAEKTKTDTIDISKDKRNSDVHTVGKIDREIYKCITDDIRTDEVIITNNQVQHIIDRHPEVYSTVLNNIQEAIRSPDYIIRDKHEYTGLVIKRIKTENEILQIVLRICTSMDEPEYKNSIISCWELSERRLQNYLRNKEILYSRE